MNATLRLFLADAEGAAFTDVRVCRVTAPWSEFSVVWASQPPPALPCTVVTVGFLPTNYDWDISEIIRGLYQGSWLNHGLILQNLNELGFNERAFYSRQGGISGLVPQLEIQFVPAVEGVESTFSSTTDIEGETFVVSVVPRTPELDAEIRGVEVFFLGQEPAWTAAEVIMLPSGWSTQATERNCFHPAGPVFSSGLRFSTNTQPLAQDEGGEFRFRVQKQDEIPTEIVQMELTSTSETYLGRITVLRADSTPVATPTPSPTATRTPSNCCEFLAGCFGSPGLTQEACEAEGGRFVAGGVCLDTGRCSGGTPVPTSSRAATATATRTYTVTATSTGTATRTQTPTHTATETPRPVVQLDLDIFRLDGTELQDDEGGKPDDEETIGSMICVNNDNDDRDPAFDNADDAVVGEDDLVLLVVRPPPLEAGQVEVSLLREGAGEVRFWSAATKGAEVKLPVTYDVTQLPQKLWIEGVQPSRSQRDVKIDLRLLPSEGGALGRPDRVALTVAGIAALRWTGKGNSVNDDDALDADPHVPAWPGARRVFPDARAAAGAPRDAVTLEVELFLEPVYDLNVFLRSFDIDDPAAHDADVDPNDDGSTGNYLGTTSVAYTAEEDNRADGKKSGRIDGEDAAGIAPVLFPSGTKKKTVEFHVTKQPGDNFRVAAACDRNFAARLRNLDEKDQERIVDADNEQTIPNSAERVSPVLTVWRRLHVERDSMTGFAALDWWRTPNANTVTGQVTARFVTGSLCAPGLPLTQLTVDQRLEDANQFANGSVFVEGPGGFLRLDVRFNTRGAPPNFLLVCGTPAGDLPTRFRLHDDDDDSILPRVPDTAWMQDGDAVANNLFAAAYGRPLYDGGGNAANDQLTVALDVNTLDAEAAAQAGLGKNAAGTADFWVSYLQSVFQGERGADWDPGLPDPVRDPGWELGFTPVRDGSIVYQENVTDMARHPQAIANAATRPDIERATVVHEVGHQVNAVHADGDIMDGGWPTAIAIPRRFSDASLNRIRCTRQVGQRLP